MRKQVRGKTAAFSLPILDALAKTISAEVSESQSERNIQALVLTPTRELAAQVAENMRLIVNFCQLR